MKRKFYTVPLLLVVVFVTLLFWSCSVQAVEEPPQEILDRVSNHFVVHYKPCRFQAINLAECYFSYDKKKRVSWLVMKDMVFFGDPHVKMIIKISRDRKGVRHTEVVWCRADVCT